MHLLAEVRPGVGDLPFELGPVGPTINLSPMSESTNEQVREILDAIYRAESGRILATLIRLLGDIDLAGDAVHDAPAAALERWPQDGVHHRRALTPRPRNKLAEFSSSKPAT